MSKLWKNKIFEAPFSSMRQILADEMKFPDIKGRHLLTVGLRIFVFLFVWILFFLHFSGVWSIAPAIPIIFNLSFLITALCTCYFVFYNKILISLFFLEVFSDVIGQTAIIYILGYDTFAPYAVYGLYVIAVGILTGYFSCLIASTVVLVCFSILSFLIQTDLLKHFDFILEQRGMLHLIHFEPYVNLMLLPLALIVIAYCVHIAHFFSKLREDALENRNNQMVALSHIGATIRHSLNLEQVRNEVLKAVVKGLKFDVCVLALVDEKKQVIRFFFLKKNYYADKLLEIFGFDFSELSLSLGVDNNSICMAIRKNKIMVRNNFSELMFGVEPKVEMQAALQAQRQLGFKKFVITPLVAEKKVLGAIIGASTTAFVEDIVIDSLENFANQAAMALESAQLIRDLEEKNLQLIEADKVKSYFLTIMSHELRTPLNAVLGYTEILMDNVLGKLNDEQRKSLSEVLRNGQNLLELINSVLDLAKLESGKMEINVDAFDLSDLAKDVKNNLMPLTAKKGHELNIHIQENLPPIKADAIKIRQILVNLIGNSIKFTKPQGEIDVFLEYYDDAHELWAQDFKEEENLSSEIKKSPAFLIRVRDNGIGIKRQDIQSIFELFKQADLGYTRDYEGSGLGLALTKQLVLLHEGRIVAESEYGKGTEIKVILPQIHEKKVTDYGGTYSHDASGA